MTEGLTVFFVRHGQTEWNREGRWQGQLDVPLNAAGRRQAALLGGRLRASAFAAAYSSDLARARETARIALPGVSPDLDPRLREMDFGEFEGATWEQIEQTHPEALRAYLADRQAFRAPGGESHAEVRERLASWLDSLPRAGTVIAFTHGGLIRAAIYEVVGAPNGSWSVAIGHTSLSAILYRPARARLLRVNDLAHLEGSTVDAEPLPA